MAITKEEVAARMDGREYGSEITKPEVAELQAAGLIALFGYSDDVIELRGVTTDEAGAGNALYFNSRGLMLSECEQEDACPYFKREVRYAAKVETEPNTNAVEGMFSFVTDIPHAKFKIMEDGELYSIGIVFSVEDLGL